MLVELAAVFENRPAYAFVAFVENTLQAAQDLLAISNALPSAAFHDVLYGFKQKLLGQDHICAVGLAEVAVGTPSHGGEALVSGDRPGISGARSGLFTVLLKQRRTGRRFEAEIIHPLPVPGKDTAGGIEMRQHARVDAGLEEIALW